jgi:hypothetical protein
MAMGVIVNKLFVILLCSLFSFQAHAEFYGSYSGHDIDTGGPRTSCSGKSQPGTKQKHRNGEITVYYPHAIRQQHCDCCPQQHISRTQWGDYVIFTSQPAKPPFGHVDRDNTFDPDTGTADDILPEIGVD